MFCSKCGKELNSGAKYCKYCGMGVEQSKPEATDKTHHNIVQSQTVEAEDIGTKLSDSNEIPKDNNAFDTQSNSSPTLKALKKITENKFYNILKDKALPKVKTFIKEYKKIKSLSLKQKILHIVPIVVVVTVILIICFGGRGLGGSNAISALYSKSALPYDVQSQINAGLGLYENVSYGEALDYMFKNPSVKTKKDNGDTLVTISGNYRWQIGGSYSSYGEIIFRISGGGSVIVEEDTYNVEGTIRNIALGLGKKY